MVVERVAMCLGGDVGWSGGDVCVGRVGGGGAGGVAGGDVCGGEWVG